MIINTLSKFLSEANKETYANKDASRVSSSRLKSKDYHFESGDFIFHDTYFGGRDFIGSEVIYEKQVAIWGANYFGFVLDENTSEKEVYGFLRNALMQENDRMIPVRGPRSFSEGKKEYCFVADGDLANFTGKEEISFDGNVIYRCFIHGGLIK